MTPSGMTALARLYLECFHAPVLYSPDMEIEIVALERAANATDDQHATIIRALRHKLNLPGSRTFSYLKARADVLHDLPPQGDPT